MSDVVSVAVCSLSSLQLIVYSSREPRRLLACIAINVSPTGFGAPKLTPSALANFCVAVNFVFIRRLSHDQCAVRQCSYRRQSVLCGRI